MKQIIHVDISIGTKHQDSPSSSSVPASPADWQHFSQVSLYAPPATRYATPHHLGGQNNEPSEAHSGSLSKQLKLQWALEWLIYQHSKPQIPLSDEHLHGLPPKE